MFSLVNTLQKNVFKISHLLLFSVFKLLSLSIRFPTVSLIFVFDCM